MTKIENEVDRVYKVNSSSTVVPGPAETEVKQIEMGRLKIVFLDPVGAPIVSPKVPTDPPSEFTAFEPILLNRWVLYIDGIRQCYVKSVEIPKLDYADYEPLLVKVEFYTEAIIERSKRSYDSIKIVGEKE